MITKKENNNSNKEKKNIIQKDTMRYKKTTRTGIPEPLE
jgi:hypothetical protein